MTSAHEQGMRRADREVVLVAATSNSMALRSAHNDHTFAVQQKSQGYILKLTLMSGRSHHQFLGRYIDLDNYKSVEGILETACAG
eukprot:2582763-Amphidinium_carterae.1